MVTSYISPSSVADSILLLLRLLKHLSIKHCVLCTPALIPVEHKDFVISGSLLSIDSMMMVCRKYTSASPEEFMFCGLGSPDLRPRQEPRSWEARDLRRA